MTKYSLLGILAIIGGGIMVGFQTLSVVMGHEVKYESLKLVNILDEKYVAWIDTVSFYGLERIPAFIVSAPVYILLFCLGGLFLVLSYLFGKK
jgi:hypothetical protein